MLTSAIQQRESAVSIHTSAPLEPPLHLCFHPTCTSPQVVRGHWGELPVWCSLSLATSCAYCNMYVLKPLSHCVSCSPSPAFAHFLVALSFYCWVIRDFKYIPDVHAKLRALCPTLCNPMDCSLPGSSVHGILQAKILEWVARPSLLQGISPTQGLNPLSYVSCIGRQVFTTSANWMLDRCHVYELQIFSPIPWVVLSSW